MFKYLLLLTYVQSIFGLDITQYCPNNPYDDADNGFQRHVDTVINVFIKNSLIK